MCVGQNVCLKKICTMMLTHYDDFRYCHKRLVDRLLSQGYIAWRLEKSSKKFCGRYQDLIEKYQRSVKEILNGFVPRIIFLWHSINAHKGRIYFLKSQTVLGSYLKGAYGNLRVKGFLLGSYSQDPSHTLN